MTTDPRGKISITIKYLVNLSENAGCREEKADFPPGSTLDDVAEYLKEKRNIKLPDERIISTMNGKSWHQYPEKLKTPIGNGNVILLLPMISGG